MRNQINTITLVILGAITGAFSLTVLFLFPDSPDSAWFLSRRERVQAVLRTKGNHAGIENKIWKRTQFYEALTDWKTWMFTLHAFCQEIGNGFSSQSNLIIKSFGYSTLETTLLGCVTGLAALVSISFSALVLAFVKVLAGFQSFLRDTYDRFAGFSRLHSGHYVCAGRP